MFKVGQKVRIKEWVDMPEGLLATWGKALYVGSVVTIEGLASQRCTNGYDVIFESRGTAFYLEGELESIIKVGQQLMFEFMNEE